VGKIRSCIPAGLTVLAAAVAAAVAMPSAARAQGDEIQVYDGGLAPKGVFNLTLHNNYAVDGIRTPSFPGAVVSHRSLNGVPEWAYGVSRWFELGMYLPLYSRDADMGWGLDGVKLRTLFAVPNADDRRFVYGANFEFSYNAKRWDTRRITSEIRPIIGWHLNTMDVIFNPIFDTSYDGLNKLEFVPSTRVAYKTSPSWAVAVEEYSDYGSLNELAPASAQGHQVFAVVDHSAPSLDIEAGVGFGLNNASDKITFKLILSHDFNRPRPKPEARAR
jgi:opacity protein-like surface antigen